jgi:hypothetical protein
VADEREPKVEPKKSPEREPDSIAAAPPTADASQQPGFRVVDEAPSRGGVKLVWTALVVVVAILVGYYFGFFR